LLHNAIKYRKKGSIPQIVISAINKNAKWEFSIEDNGIGIDIKDKDKVFMIFQRLNNRQQYQGTGIGLAYCKKIITLYGGKIWVESELNKGSTFYFNLPN
ncbi:MAG: PAS domain-containing sensor histidine kinase, partial [Flavobacteriaceae bacterium]|nr:PAS domain-containing sensor histidine kinase [Flavobacteriaceae bacterium]